MERKVDKKRCKMNIEKITNEPFDDIIGHSESIRKYFTIENNDLIYKRLKKETDIVKLPYLGPCVDYGLGDICIEESSKDNKEIFKFYIIDKTCKFDYQEFAKIEDVIAKLISHYKEKHLISNPEKMQAIFTETLKLSINKNH